MLAVKAEEKAFGKDEIVFREGESGDAVYVVVEGRVEILKTGPEGPVIVAVLGPGQMFGEMGVLDDGPRNASAVASADTVLRVVPRKDFRDWIRQDSEAAMRVIRLLTERLRTAEDIISRHRSGPAAGQPDGRRLPLLGAILSWLRRRRGQIAAAASNAPAGFVIGVAAINNDVDGAWTRALADLFAECYGISTRIIGSALQLEPNPDQTQIQAALVKARQILAREDDLDLLLWGDVHAEGFTLYFTPAGPGDEERPGAFVIPFALELAGDLAPPVGDLLMLASLAAFEPGTDAKKALQRQLLPAAFQAMESFPASLPVAWTMDQQRTGLACFGHAAATIANWEADGTAYDTAAEAYRAAIKRLAHAENGLSRALLCKYLGQALAAAGERRSDMALIEAAVQEFRASLDCLTRATHPQEWAAAQERLGLTLYRFEHLTGQPDLLKEALGAFQAALQVFTRAEAPARWADTMSNLAQVLMVYGDQMKNVEVLERAAEAARAALEFRSRERNPAQWAAGQNVLGTALFLLDKHGKGAATHAEAAQAALSAAADTYHTLGAHRLAGVAEKNLSHVQKLVEAQGGRKPA